MVGHFISKEQQLEKHQSMKHMRFERYKVVCLAKEKHSVGLV